MFTLYIYDLSLISRCGGDAGCVTATVPDVFVPTGVAMEWDFHSTVTMLENIFYSITAHNNNLNQYFNNNTV